MALLELAIDFTIEVLEPGGIFLAKAFRGGADNDIMQLLNKQFEKVRYLKPAASRAESVETYLLATGFRGAVLDEREDDTQKAEQRAV
jgi:23S rRNA (uridine2552-2'-O)-methyltransferase